jgi:hypothetical protein
MDQLTAALRGDPASGGQRQGQETAAGDGQPSNVPDEIEVPLKGGATRRVKLKDLVDKADRAEAAEQRAQLLSGELQKSAAAQAFIKQLDAVAPEDREAFMQVLANPKLARKLAQKAIAEDEEGASEEEIDELVRPSGARKKDPAGDPRIDRMEQVLRGLVEHVRGDVQQKLQQSTASQVEQLMASFPVFEENAAGAKMAKTSILRAVAADKSADLDALVAEHATGLHEMLQAERQSYTQQTRPTGRTSPRSLPKAPVGGASPGSDLESGKLGRELMKSFRY